ncbi:hypothetical protein ACNKHP_23635 [Shigella boydii]
MQTWLKTRKIRQWWHITPAHAAALFSWKTKRWDFLRKTSSSHARLNAPALVQVVALAIIMIRGLDVPMISIRWACVVLASSFIAAYKPGV